MRFRRIPMDPFQFHTGSIKSNHRLLAKEIQRLGFQFHTGSIKRQSIADMFQAQASFNSILVRLKDQIGIKVLDHVIMFQFHTGSIKSTCVGD